MSIQAPAGLIVVRRQTCVLKGSASAGARPTKMVELGVTGVELSEHDELLKFARGNPYSTNGRKVHLARTGELGKSVVEALFTDSWVPEVWISGRKAIILILESNTARIKTSVQIFMDIASQICATCDLQLVDDRGCELRWGR